MLNSILQRKLALRGRKDLTGRRSTSTVELEVDDVETKDQVISDANANNADDDATSTTKRDGLNLCKMIADERWMDIQELLTTPKDDDVHIIDEDGAITRELIMHHACSHKAPREVLLSLSSEYWKSLYCVDKDGRFPIHVAALNGAGPGIISFLINSNHASAGIKDSLGKTPLHYICEDFEDKNKGANILRIQQDLYVNVVLLIKAAPSSVNVEDDEEMNPIEYAIASDASVQVIKEMQKASRSCWRARKKREGWRRHDEYAQFLQEQSSSSSLKDSQPRRYSNSAA